MKSATKKRGKVVRVRPVETERRAVLLTAEAWKACDDLIAATGLGSQSAVVEQAVRAFAKANGVAIAPPSERGDTKSGEAPQKGVK